jgi:hypothetical protein
VREISLASPRPRSRDGSSRGAQSDAAARVLRSCATRITHISQRLLELQRPPDDLDEAKTLLSLLIGLVIGGTFGALGLALLVTSSHADDAALAAAEELALTQ